MKLTREICKLTIDLIVFDQRAFIIHGILVSSPMGNILATLTSVFRDHSWVIFPSRD